MGRLLAVSSLVLLSGCSSCVEDKTVPESTTPTGTNTTKVITVDHDGGKKKIEVGEGLGGFAGAVRKDAGAD